MKKFLRILAVVFLLLIIAAIAIPFIYKDKIAAMAKEEINKNINAKVNFTGFGLTIISSFPNLTFSLDNVSVIGVNEFEGDTLTFIKKFSVTLGLWDVIGSGQKKIKSITLDNPYINIIVLKNGKANYDISKPDTSKNATAAQPSSFKLALQSYAINNGRISYDDNSVGFKTTMVNVNHKGSGDFTQDLFILKTNTTADKMNVWYGGIKYVDEANTKLDMNLDMDMKNAKYTFKENELTLNELVLGMDGWLAMPGNDINMDLKWNVKKNDFRNFLSMVPGVYRSDFKDLKSSGKLELNGFVKGTYNDQKMPGYGLNLKVNNGMFAYPGLPTSVNNVNVDLNVNNPDGVTDHTVIDMKSMHVELGTEPFDARLYVTTPVSDANIDAMIKGTVNLANVKNIVPLDKETEMNGILKADITMKGRYSAIANKQFDKFNAAGTFALSSMTYKSKDYPAATINNMVLAFNPTNVTLSAFDMKMGKSDIKASGSIDNLLAYYFKKELLKGSFSLTSNLLDLNEMMTGKSSAAGAAPDTSKLSVIVLPSNIDFTLNTSIGKILYDDLVIDNLKGSVTLSNETLNMQNLVFNMLNGAVKMSGKYATPNPTKPDFDYNLSLSGFDIQQTVKTFNTVKKLAPIAERANGKFSSDLTINGKLDAHMQPVYKTLNGGGKLNTQNVSISNFEPLNKIADALKMEDYKQLQLQNVNVSFRFKDGRVNVDPFETNLQGSNAKIQGSNGFDQTIDYTVNLSIPKNHLPPAAVSAMSGLLGKASKLTGTNIQLPDPLKVNLGIGGTVTKPTIKTDLGNQGASVVSAVKQQVSAQARAQADKIIAEAQKQAQQLRDAAKQLSDKTRTEGYAAADKLVSSANNPIAKAAAQTTAKKMKQETDKKAQQIIDDGNKNAQAVIDAAKKKSDDLLK